MLLNELMVELASSGLIGAVAILFMVLWLKNQKKLEDTRKEMNKEVKEAQEKKDAANERLIGKGETWIQKYHERSSQQSHVLDALVNLSYKDRDEIRKAVTEIRGVAELLK